ncbi:MAG: hypothetical protein ACYCPS_00435 [Candidatus Saccharimonadales bacterium]
MRNPLAIPPGFNFNPEAEKLHSEGIIATGQNDFDLAYGYFDQAMQTLHGLPQTIDVMVQTAENFRDAGFCHVRQSAYDLERMHLVLGQQLIQLSRVMTSNLFRQNSVPDAMVITPLRQYTLHAIHGKTLSAYACTKTVDQWFFDVDRLDRNRFYGQAHRHLVQGNDVLAFVNNAVAAARSEKLAEKRLATHGWLFRATTGLASISLKDPNPSNRVHAAIAVADGLRDVATIKNSLTSLNMWLGQ